MFQLRPKFIRTDLLVKKSIPNLPDTPNLFMNWADIAALQYQRGNYILFPLNIPDIQTYDSWVNPI